MHAQLRVTPICGQVLPTFPDDPICLVSATGPRMPGSWLAIVNGFSHVQLSLLSNSTKGFFSVLTFRMSVTLRLSGGNVKLYAVYQVVYFGKIRSWAGIHRMHASLLDNTRRPVLGLWHSLLSLQGWSSSRNSAQSILFFGLCSDVAYHEGFPWLSCLKQHSCPPAAHTHTPLSCFTVFCGTYRPLTCYCLSSSPGI